MRCLASGFGVQGLGLGSTGGVQAVYKVRGLEMEKICVSVFLTGFRGFEAVGL